MIRESFKGTFHKPRSANKLYIINKKAEQSESGRDGNLCRKQSSANIGPSKRNFLSAPKTSNRINDLPRDVLNSL